MAGANDFRPKVWGRRPYAGKTARELLNDISGWIARTRPADVDDPEDPTLADVIRHAGPALSAGMDGDGSKARTLTELLRHGLTFQEAVTWYWFRYCRYDITEIHFAMNGTRGGGDMTQRRQTTRNIVRDLSQAASNLPDDSSDDVPPMVDDRKRHDRTDDDFEDEIET